MIYFIQILPQILFLGALYSILALGYSFLYGANRFFDITYASYIVLGVYLFFYISSIGIPVFLSIILVYLLILLTAFLFEGVLYNRLRFKKASSVALMLTSFGLLTVVQGIISIIFSSDLQVFNFTNRIFTFGTITFSLVQLVTVLTAIIIYLLSYLLLKRTKFGDRFRAVSENAELAKTIGINVEKTRIIAVMIAACVAATGGILFGLDSRIYPFLGIDLLFKAVIAAIVSGLASPLYGFAGGFLLSFAENSFAWLLLGQWKDALSFVILILILLFRPSGIIKR
jgi:branched-subunit amino acid ABC-type transport system permease component